MERHIAAMGCLCVLLLAHHAAGQATCATGPAACPLNDVAATAPATDASADCPDDKLAAAELYVQKHADKYMHHEKVTRGMKGYGLTVMHGTEIVKFDVEIVSVMKRWGPHQDAILAKLSGLGLEKSGILAGMSGSPCYIKDADGKDKMIGAVAFGWEFPKEALCGIQPITQMIAVSGLCDKIKPAASTAPAVAAGGSGPASRQFIKTFLSPRKLDFTDPEVLGQKPPRNVSTARKGITRLGTPLSISGTSDKAQDGLSRLLRPMGLIPVQGGGVGQKDVAAAGDGKFAPGSAVAIHLISGDADVTAVGTVTEVIDDRVLIFGHSFFSFGEADFPMGPAYIHTPVSGYADSFKLGSAILDAKGQPLVTARLVRDENVAVVGVTGQKADMIPVTVTVSWEKDGRKQVYNYKIAKHPLVSIAALAYCVRDASWGWHDLPEHHTVEHKVQVDYGDMGTYRCGNVSSGEDVFTALSDTARPVAAMIRNPFGTPVFPRSVSVELTIKDDESVARIMNFKLDGTIYKPGDTVRGNVTIRLPRQQDKVVPVRVTLPADLPEGDYTLEACDSDDASSKLRYQQPHRFDPRSAADLLAALKCTVSTKAGNIYICMPIHRGGMAIGKDELPDLPASKAELIREAGLLDTHNFSQTLFKSIPTQYVIVGSDSASFSVQDKPKETLLNR